jgi:hypothetical protein
MMWLSIGMDTSIEEIYLCCDLQTHHYGWVVIEPDGHPWLYDTRAEQHGSFLSYLRTKVLLDKNLRRLVGQMKTLLRAEDIRCVKNQRCCP